MATTGGSEAKNNPHGIDKEIWSKIAGKFSGTSAILVVDWVSKVCKEQMPDQTTDTAAWFSAIFKDGYFLTKLMLSLEPGFKKSGITGASKWKPKHSTRPFTCRENIEIFGRACVWMGMRETDKVSSQDVYNEENPNALLCALYSLCALAVKRGWDGPVIADGFKHAVENKREFDEETLRKGRTAIPMMSRGAREIDRGPQLDGAGIVKTAGNEGHKADYSTLSTWQSGGIEVASAEPVDQIIRTKANDDWKASSEVPLTSKGARNLSSNDGLDGYGVVRQPKKKGEN